MPSSKPNQVLASNFCLNIQGLEKTAPRIASVERITAKRLFLTGTGGKDTFAQGQPTLLDCSTLSLFLPESEAGPFYAWFDDSVVKGKGGSAVACCSCCHRR